jgi:hypothetical protein
VDIGEAITVDISIERHDPDCYFCQAHTTPKEETNDHTDSYPEDKDLDGLEAGGVKFKNDAGKLGGALGGKPDDRTIILGDDSKPFPSSVAAHHLIPGNASLKNSRLFKSKKYLRIDGMAKGNIGYNINSQPNGVWLPGNYAQRPWGAAGASFARKYRLSPQTYAFESIYKWRAQFHDAHQNYSKFVTKVLNELCQKLKDSENIWCPKAKKKEENPEDRNLYALVNRLHTVSGRMRRMLVLPTTNWKANIFTSRFSSAFMKARPHAK